LIVRGAGVPDCAAPGGRLSTGMTSMRGVGDRWLAGEPVDGVRFAHHDRVEITGGALDGARGTIALLVGLVPEPSYLVSRGAAGDVKVRQSSLRPAT
jgi:hypothetical protein